MATSHSMSMNTFFTSPRRISSIGIETGTSTEHRHEGTCRKGEWPG
jgi:hypothetical protein